MDRERILGLAHDTAAQVTEWRRHLHRYPELSFEEAETSAFVAQRLTDMGYQPQTNFGGGYGVVATLEGGRPGPTIAFRADMDALPIHEETGLEWSSTRPGKMHACGHDAHTSTLLGAAKVMRQLQREIPGKIVFVFQPAEEKPPGGAQGMVKAGVLEGVEAIFGLHVTNPLPVGHMGFRAGPVNAASDSFKITLRGKGGHAAYPHITVDPIAMLGATIQGIQNVVSRMVNPTESAVVTIGWVKAGDANNVIPEVAELGGTIRTLTDETRDLVPGKLEAVARGAAAMFGGAADVEVLRGYPVNVNDARMNEIARQAAEMVIGAENCVEPPLGMGGEDFAFYSRVRPSCFARLGTGLPGRAPLPAHNPRFVIEEGAFPVGLAWYLSLALNYAALAK